MNEQVPHFKRGDIVEFRDTFSVRAYVTESIGSSQYVIVEALQSKRDTEQTAYHTGIYYILDTYPFAIPERHLRLVERKESP
jgi:hypothetical protein